MNFLRIVLVAALTAYGGIMAGAAKAAPAGAFSLGRQCADPSNTSPQSLGRKGLVVQKALLAQVALLA